MIPQANEPSRRVLTPPEAPAERAEEIRARMEALLKRLPPREPERRES